MLKQIIILVLSFIIVSFPTTNMEAKITPSDLVVKASWYQCCKITANGEKFKPDELTAAHKYLKFGTRVEIRSLKTGKKIIVRINDRGPYIKGRDIDLSRGAAKKLGILKIGVAFVTMKVLK